MDMDIFKILCKETIDEELTQIIKDKLLLKYKEEFEVYKIGKRYGASSSNDSVTAYCRSTKNKDLLFIATLYKDKVHFQDDYYLRLVCFELQQELIKVFKENNVEVYPRVNIIGLNEYDKKQKLQDFIEKEKNTNFLLELYVKGKVELSVLKKSMKMVKEKYKSINIRGDITLLDSEHYEEYANIFKEMCDEDDYTVELKDIIEEYRVERI